MYKLLLSSLFVFTLLVGCNQAPPEPEIPQPITVEFQVQPEPVKAGEITTIQVFVKQGEEWVDDAQEVEFEIWKDGQEKHDMVQAQYQGDGLYSFQERFHEPGTYYVMYHVTARDMHEMKAMEVVVTGEEKPEQQAQQQAEDHHHDHGVNIHFIGDKEAKANQPQTFLAHIQKDGTPLDGAVVRFEYWQVNDSKHIYADAMEQKPGEYAAEVILPISGEYRVVTHVEKEELHEHKENSLLLN
ncbi:FixH family protein [Ammoniphilus sp. CFH 90114]|uniref:FixH family protein n=1 Tax=Ammoniphilus sp. CFH 90114 TaxID=2493665 RepID=UPI0013E9926A|nr:FixH family protein [Ammoniphilus sp. CFH 90114]